MKNKEINLTLCWYWWGSELLCGAEGEVGQFEIVRRELILLVQNLLDLRWYIIFPLVTHLTHHGGEQGRATHRRDIQPVKIFIMGHFASVWVFIWT